MAYVKVVLMVGKLVDSWELSLENMSAMRMVEQLDGKKVVMLAAQLVQWKVASLEKCLEKSMVGRKEMLLVDDLVDL